MNARPLPGTRVAAATRDDAETTEEALAMRERHNERARFWRMTLGTLGLFWVGVLLLLMG
jgi:hypothetical protein